MHAMVRQERHALGLHVAAGKLQLARMEAELAALRTAIERSQSATAPEVPEAIAAVSGTVEAMGKDLGVTLTVDNRTGGGGIIGHQAIADAEPDGYTIGMITFELSTY